MNSAGQGETFPVEKEKPEPEHFHEKVCQTFKQMKSFWKVIPKGNDIFPEGSIVLNEIEIEFCPFCGKQITVDYNAVKKPEFKEGDECPLKNAGPFIQKHCFSNESPFCEHCDEDCCFIDDIVMKTTESCMKRIPQKYNGCPWQRLGKVSKIYYCHAPKHIYKIDRHSDTQYFACCGCEPYTKCGVYQQEIKETAISLKIDTLTHACETQVFNITPEKWVELKTSLEQKTDVKIDEFLEQQGITTDWENNEQFIVSWFNKDTKQWVQIFEE